MAKEQSAEELVARVVERDEAALGLLYDRFAPRLLALLLRILPERGAAEEALQNVFLQLWKKAPQSKSWTASLPAWLLFMARNTAVNRRRAREGLGPQPCGDPVTLGRIADWCPLPAQIALVDSRQELFRKFMNQLPLHQRRALDLAVFEGRRETEVAQKLGEPLGKAKAELRAAMSFLRHRTRAILGTWSANI